MTKQLPSECFVFGTRPEIIKFAPLWKKLDKKCMTVHTGQHRELAEEAFSIFNLYPDYDLQLMTENQTLSGFISVCVTALDKIFKEHPEIKRVWVQGDTSTAFSAALAAFNNKIPVVHLEAGLRTHNIINPFPEELYRTMIDNIADILFAPTDGNVDNLEKENAHGQIFKVGNTIVDALEMIKPSLTVRPIEEEYVLLTMHRRESFGKPMEDVFAIAKELSKRITVIFPMHPNPEVRKAAEKVGIKTMSPLNYITFLSFLKYCKFVISDSGGITEEVASFNKPLLILRTVTERQEILGKNAFLTDLTKEDLQKKIDMLMSMTECNYQGNPFGDGKTVQRIVEYLKIK